MGAGLYSIHKVFAQASSGDSYKSDTKAEVVPPIPHPNRPTHGQEFFFRNEVLKLYPDIQFHSNFGAEDIYRCRSKSSFCPSCETFHEENIVGEYRTRSYNLRCMYRYIGKLEVVEWW